MRIFAAIFINIILIGGLTLYMNHRDNKAPVEKTPVQTTISQGVYTLEITPGFAPAPDPFALETDKPALLLVKTGSREILRKTESVKAGKLLRIENLSGMVIGHNEIHIQASPPSEDNAHHALRMRVLENENPVADATFWAPPGMGINNTLYFSIGSEKKAEARHD